ncbi:MAG: hypothetical protein GTO02_00670 [Candidatus Dadabacteria bacterium]|nr:hypothetical protein [Candidatus Dadabacteria bacterium]
MSNLINDSTQIINRLKILFNLDTDANLAKQLKISPARLSNWKVRNSIDYEIVLNSMLNANPDADLNWLLKRNNSENHLNNRLNESVTAYKTNNTIQHIDYIEVGAGNQPTIKNNQLVNQIPIPDDLVDEGVILAIVCDDCMYPKIKEGARILIDTRSKEIKSGEIYCIDIPNEGLTVKRIFKAPNKIILRSENQKYPELELTYDEIESYKKPLIIGRVRFIAEFRR